MNTPPKRRNDSIGAVAGYVLICVLVIVAVAGITLAQTQGAIDAARTQQEALACFKAPQMCSGQQLKK